MRLAVLSSLIHECMLSTSPRVRLVAKIFLPCRYTMLRGASAVHQTIASQCR